MIFEREFPRYLSIGMSAAEFWDGDCLLVKAYREAQRLRDEREDAIAWLQGRYVYEALRDVSPLFQAFSKRTPKEHPYLEKPLMEMIKEQKIRETYEHKRRSGIDFMVQYAQRFNTRFKGKQSGGEKP